MTKILSQDNIESILEEAKIEDTETEKTFEILPFTLPDRGLTSLRKLTDYIGLEKVRDLINVLPENLSIIKIGKLSNSMIDLGELQKCLAELKINPVPSVVIATPESNYIEACKVRKIEKLNVKTES